MTTDRRPSPQQRRLLRHLLLHPDATQRERGKALSCSYQRIAQHLRAMAHHGWTTSEGPRMPWSLTDAGRALAEARR